MLDEALVREFVRIGSGLGGDADSAVIAGNPKAGARPKVPYASVLPITDERLGYPFREYPVDATGNPGDAVEATPRRVTYSVQFYRTGALGFALALASWTESEPGLDAAEDRDFRVVFPFNVRRLDLRVGDAWEERAVIDLPLDYFDIRSGAAASTFIEGVATTVCVTGFDVETISDG